MLSKTFKNTFTKYIHHRKKCKYSTKNIYLSDIEQNVILPERAKVVICGGGVMGASVAYHLAERNCTDVVIIDKGKIGSGATWHSAGLVGAFKPTLTQVKLAQSSINLYKTLELNGSYTGWKQCGSLNLARTKDRITVFKRMKAQSIAWGIECEIITPIDAKKICPILEISDLEGALWIPGDGVGDPYEICLTLISKAKEKGVVVKENCQITRVLHKNKKISEILTDDGSIECEYFVNCAGIWARNVGQLSEPYVKVPIHACEHHYLHTKPISNLSPMTPVVRDLDGFIYFRENNGRLLAGGYEPNAKPVFEDFSMPDNLEEKNLPPDWDHFHPLLEELLKRVPILNDAKLERLCNSAEAFTPDCKWIFGETPEIKDYLVASGMKAVGISAAGGIGQATTDIILNGFTEYDMYELEISRFLGLHNNRKFLRDRVREIPSKHYSLAYPFNEFITGRKLRMSPIYPPLRDAGAVFGQVMGYERPNYFDPNNETTIDDDTVVNTKPFRICKKQNFSKPVWFDLVGHEYEACREAIGISDYSSFTKIDLWSKDEEVVNALQFICSNNVDVPVGSIIHTGMQNEYGGYENDCSLVRVAHNHYMMIAPTIQQTRCKVWLERHLPKDGSVSMTDVTSMYTAICLMGPFTKSLLSELTDTDLNAKNFPFFTYKELDVGLANGIRAINLTHTGELGYVLYIPNEFALHVYLKLIEHGKPYGIRHAGYYSMRALRVEKFYAFWGQDLDTKTTPLECGRSWRVKFDKPFIGRDALLKQSEEGVKRRYVQLLLNDHDQDTDLWPWGGEPIYRNGINCGETTTTGFGYTFKKQVCLGFIRNIDNKGNYQEVTNDFALSGDYEVDIAGKRYSAKLNLHSPTVPSKYPDREREAYFATRDKNKEEPILVDLKH